MPISLADPVTFKNFYGFIFDYGREGAQKSLDLESALELWKILLVDKFGRLADWRRFLKQRKAHRSVSKDTWDLLLEFAVTIDSSFATLLLISPRLFIPWKYLKTFLSKLLVPVKKANN